MVANLPGNAIAVAFAIDLEAEGIKVNAVTPGFTAESVQQAAPKSSPAALYPQVIIGASPEMLFRGSPQPDIVFTPDHLHYR